MSERMFEKYRPRVLADVVGQPPVAYLKALAARPYPCCVLLHGPGGCGKTSAAYAFAAELGCTDDMSGLYQIDSCDLTIDNVRALFEDKLRLYPMCNPRGLWKCLIIEEMEAVNPTVVKKLKTGLETKLPAHVIVVATSNAKDKIDPILRQRLKPYEFKTGVDFTVAALKLMQGIWAKEAPGFQLPPDYVLWGWDGPEFSLRVALDEMQNHLSVIEPLLAARGAT